MAGGSGALAGSFRAGVAGRHAALPPDRNRRRNRDRNRPVTGNRYGVKHGLQNGELQGAEVKDAEVQNSEGQNPDGRNDDLKLLVEWSSPWDEFLTAIGPALRKSPKRLAGEARTNCFPTGAFSSHGWWSRAAACRHRAACEPRQHAPLSAADQAEVRRHLLLRQRTAADRRSGRSPRRPLRALRRTRGPSPHANHPGGPRRHAARNGSRRPQTDLPASNSAVANLLAYKPVPGPAPAEGLKHSRQAPKLAENPVAPAPQVETEKMRKAPALNAAIVPPPPSAAQRDIATIRIPGSHAVSVVPPPVSAPEQITNLNSRLTMPAPSVVAPAPTQVARDLKARGPGFGAGELQKQIVPPPVQLGGAASDRRSFGGLGTANVVPPPVQVAAGSLRGQTVAGLGGSPAVVPPPPTVSGGGSSTGLGTGNRGTGLGGPLDAGSVTAPPSNSGGNTSGNGIVLSSQPGSKVGVPGGAEPAPWHCLPQVETS